MVERSPEKAGVGGSTPSLATIFLRSGPETRVRKDCTSPPRVLTFPKGPHRGGEMKLERLPAPRSNSALLRPSAEVPLEAPTRTRHIHVALARGRSAPGRHQFCSPSPATVEKISRIVAPTPTAPAVNITVDRSPHAVGDVLLPNPIQKPHSS